VGWAKSRQLNNSGFLKKIRAFTFIQPPVPFSLMEKGATCLRLVKRDGFVAGASWRAAAPAAFGRELVRGGARKIVTNWSMLLI